MSSPPRSSKSLAVAPLAGALLGMASLLATTPASATTAVFFPKGSTSRVERQHVTLAVTATGAVTWNAIDISGDATAEVGVIVAVRAGGRVEVAGRVWIDVLEKAAGVVVSGLPAGDCKLITGGSFGVGADGGFDIPGLGGLGNIDTGGCNSGCDNRASGSGSGAGGCFSNSSDSNSGCSGCSCDDLEPSQNGHLGCSAFACGPMDTNAPGSSGSVRPPDSGPTATRVGPYDLFRVKASDGSARAWLDVNGYEAGASFDAAAAAVEKDGYELYAMRARGATPSSLVRSLRVVTSSKTAALPLRMLRMGAGGAPSSTPLTLTVLADAPQQIVGVSALKVDTARLAWSGSSSNYESLVGQLLGGDAGTDTRWVVESARPVSNRLTPKEDGGGTSSDAGTTLADEFLARCDERTPEKHAICGASDDGGLDDGGDDDGGTPSDAGSDAGPKDASVDADAEDAGASDGECKDVDRRACDDIDLAIPPNGTVTATRFRAVIGGDAAAIADVSFSATTEALPGGRFWVRLDGQAGICEPPAGAVSLGSEVSGDVGGEASCRQVRRPVRWIPNLGPLAIFLVAARAVAAIMRRARR